MMIMYRLVAFVAVMTIGLANAVAYAADQAQPEYTFQECNQIDEAALRTELNSIAQQALADDQIAIAAIVEREWRRLDIDSVIDAEVARAVAEVHEQQGYLSRLWSAWSPDKANELATEVATLAFGSEGFQHAIAALSGAIADKIAAEIETASVRSVSSALSCLQAFIGQNYSQSLLGVFEMEIKSQVDALDLMPSGGSPMTLIDMHSTALAGLGVIIGTQIARRLAQRLAARIAGRIVTRVVGRAAAAMVPIVGWIAGAGLIVWDLVAGAEGALPQIQQALVSDVVKAEIKSEIVDAVAPELARELPAVAREVSNSIFSTWLDFKKQYAGVLALAEQSPAFKAILDETATDDIYHLARLVAIGTEALGREQLLDEIDRGRFARVLTLPASALQILATSRSMATTIGWGELAGTQRQLDAVVALEIYKLREPAAFDKDSLAALTALADKTAVQRVLLLDQPDRNALLTLPTENLAALATRYDSGDLRWLAAYIASIADLNGRTQLVLRLLQQPQLIAKLKNERVKQALASGDDVGQLLDFIAAKPGMLTFLGDASALANGAVSVSLFWHKYGTPRNIAIVLGIVALWLGLKWLRRRRAPQVIVHMPSNPPDGGPPSRQRKNRDA